MPQISCQCRRSRTARCLGDVLESGFLRTAAFCVLIPAALLKILSAFGDAKVLEMPDPVLESGWRTP